MPALDAPRVSVIMPVRDGARWIVAACRGVLEQSLADFELIVVDDGSTDETPGIVEDLARADARVRLIRQNPKGLVGALNHAIALARAPLLARLDADDIALPGRLERQATILDHDPGLVLLGGWARKIDENGRLIGDLRPPSEPDRLMAILERGNPLIHSSIMMRAEAVRQVGGYREVCRHAEDYDLWLRLAEIGGVAVLPEAMIEYRVHERGVTRQHRLSQCFSARLARRAAFIRRSTGVDPLAALSEPPDWRAEEALQSFYADDAVIYRFLDFANAGAAPSANIADSRMPTRAMFADLGHDEKKFARRAIRNLLARPDRPKAFSRGELLLQALHGALSWRLI